MAKTFSFKKRFLFGVLITFIFSLLCCTGIFAKTDISFISISQNDKSVTTKWKPVSGASYYIIYKIPEKSSESGFKYKIKTTSYVDKGKLTQNNYYYYIVYAYDKNDKELAYGLSGIKKISSPVVTSFAPSGGKVSIKWKKNPYADRYRIQYSKGSNFNISGAKTVYIGKDKDSATVTGLASGTTYTFRLAAEKKGYMLNKKYGTTTSGWIVKTIKTSAPAAKTYKTQFAGWINIDNGIHFSWKRVSGVNGYKIFRKKGNESWKLLASVNANTNSFTDKRTIIGTKYTYSVVGYKGNSSFSYKNGISQYKALVRLTKPERECEKKYKGTKYIEFDPYNNRKSLSTTKSYKTSFTDECNSVKAADCLIVQRLDSKGKVLKTDVIKKNNSRKTGFLVKTSGLSKAYRYIRVRYAKTAGGIVYGGVWSNKIKTY